MQMCTEMLMGEKHTSIPLFPCPGLINSQLNFHEKRVKFGRKSLDTGSSLERGSRKRRISLEISGTLGFQRTQEDVFFLFFSFSLFFLFPFFATLCYRTAYKTRYEH